MSQESRHRADRVRVLGLPVDGLDVAGLLAQIDRTGRLAVAAGGATNFGYALGPAVAGRLLESFDPSAFLYIVVGGTALSLVLLLPLAPQLERRDEGRTR